MRSEETVLSQVKQWAERRGDVRAVLLTSSRADPTRNPDRLSDYDVAVYVDDTDPFCADDAWVREFGSIMVRWPLRPQPTFSEEWVTQLVLFDDGVRIDFQVTAREEVDRSELDGGYRVLFDRDGLTKDLPEPTYTLYAVKRPTVEEYRDRLNAFWWDIVYVAKALWRGELNFAKYMLDSVIRFEQVRPIVCWYIGVRRDWSVNVGVQGRWIHRYLDPPVWEQYQRTFAGAGLAENWTAMFETTAFVRRVGRSVGEALGFDYPEETDAKVSRYIRQIRSME